MRQSLLLRYIHITNLFFRFVLLLHLLATRFLKLRTSTSDSINTQRARNILNTDATQRTWRISSRSRFFISFCSSFFVSARLQPTQHPQKMSSSITIRARATALTARRFLRRSHSPHPRRHRGPALLLHAPPLVQPPVAVPLSRRPPSSCPCACAAQRDRHQLVFHQPSRRLRHQLPLLRLRCAAIIHFIRHTQPDPSSSQSFDSSTRNNTATSSLQTPMDAPWSRGSSRRSRG